MTLQDTREVIEGAAVAEKESLSLRDFDELRSEWFRLAMSCDVPEDGGLEIASGVSERES